MGELLVWRLKGTTAPFTASKLVTLPCTVKDARSKLKEECGLQNATVIDFVLYLATADSQVLADDYELKGSCQVLVKRCSASEAKQLVEAANKAKSSSATKQAQVLTSKTDKVSPTLSGQRQSRPSESSRSRATEIETPSQTLRRDAPSIETEAKQKQGKEYKDHAQNSIAASTAPGKQHRTVHFAIDDDEEIVNDTAGRTAEDNEEFDPDQDVEPPSDDEDLRIKSAMQEKDVYGGDSQDQTTRRYYRARGQKTGDQPSDTGPYGPGHSYASQSQRQKGTTGGSTSLRTLYTETPVYDVSSLSQHYICHMCGQKGHHIKNCNMQEGQRPHKKIRPSTGIPVDFLEVIKDEDLDKYDEVYQLKTGQLAIMKDMSTVSGGAFFTKSADQHIQSQLGISEEVSKNMLRGLTCSACNKLFTQPVTTFCCGESYCQQCLVDTADNSGNMEIGNTFNCPGCSSSLSYADIHENTSLKEAVEDLVFKKESFNLSALHDSVGDDDAQESYCGIPAQKEKLMAFLERWVTNATVIIQFKRQRTVIAEYLAKRQKNEG